MISGTNLSFFREQEELSIRLKADLQQSTNKASKLENEVKISKVQTYIDIVICML